ncbi:MAG: hypothetical protein KJ927_08565 [Candidatus Eisenbacteria bacterium]|nr:hypothetical protein [Candidatus Eisenbacteria bacterium]MBU1948748.1 hypothetical protein [Candidatus Eisenbacteria bacterium]
MTRHKSGCETKPLGCLRKATAGCGWVSLAFICLLLTLFPQISLGQTPDVSQNDSLDTAIPNPQERLPFELPEVVVRGEDLSLIVGGRHLEADQPSLELSPLGRPQISNPPHPVLNWLRQRPFQLHPSVPAAASRPRSFLECRGGPLPDAGLRFITAGGKDTAWRLDARGEWAEDPVPDTNRRALSVKYQAARGFWPQDRWSLRGEFSARRSDWDLPALHVKGPQRFTGTRFGYDRFGHHSGLALQFEGAGFESMNNMEASHWASTELRWDYSLKSSHPELRRPEFSLWGKGIWSEQSGRNEVYPASALFEDPNHSWAPWRSLGEAQAGTWIAESADLDLWLGVQGLWDQERVFLSPHILARWSLRPHRMILWSEVVSRVQLDPWWEESLNRDYAVQDLHRESTLELPAFKIGGDWESAGWRLRAEAALRRLRSPRTWIEDEISGFYLPVTTQGRWIGDGRVVWSSPAGKRHSFELAAGFFHDGAGDGDINSEVITFQPPLWVKLTATSGWGPYTAGLTVEGWGETPQDNEESLPEWMTATLELGRFMGSIGRFWFRVNNIMNDPAKRWTFVDGSQRSYHLGWDLYF